MSSNERQDNILSIVTPSLNQGEFIEETIRSVLSQDGDFYIDYIINDGGSGDESVRIIRFYEDLLSRNCDVIEKSGLSFYTSRGKGFEWNRCLGISYRWVSEKDRGQADAINKGMRMAMGRVAAFINSDDVYCPGAFQKVLRIDWDKTDFVYGQGMWISEGGRDLLYYPTLKPTRYSMYYQCTLCQPTVFFRKDTYDRLGEFALQYSCAFDYEYWLRAIFQGCTFTFLNEPLARSRMHTANKSLRSKPRNDEEVEELKKSYFSDKESLMSAPGLWFRFFTVQPATNWRVSRLKKLLARHP